MEKRIAQFISYIFHPLLMPTYSLITLFQIKSYTSYAIPRQAKIAILAIVFLNTALLPALVFFFLKMRNVISSLKMENRNERIIPFVVTAFFYFSTFILLRKFHLPPLIYYLLFGSSCLIIVALIINFWWKISIHMIGIGGMAGAFTSIAVYLSRSPLMYISLVILIAGFIGFARLKLLAHTRLQVYGGFVVGSFLMVFLFFLIS